jgi:hypothetical protein
MRGRLVAVGVLALVVVLAVVVARIVIGQATHPFAQTSSCTVTGTSFQFSTEQAANAATISAVALERGLPERAVVIALATALQESKLTNINYGDRDSLGLFQQRPSQGWGEPNQLMDPRYAAGKFYDALVRVPHWTTRPLTDAAQAVQRSGFPDEYAKWEPRADALARALLGTTPAGLRCSFPKPKATEIEATQGPGARLPSRQEAVLAALRGDFPSAARVGGSGPVVEVTPASWASAVWLVANAERLGVEAVSFHGRTWTRERGRDGWREDPRAPDGAVRFTVLAGQ